MTDVKPRRCSIEVLIQKNRACALQLSDLQLPHSEIARRDFRTTIFWSLSSLSPARLLEKVAAEQCRPSRRICILTPAASTEPTLNLCLSPPSSAPSLQTTPAAITIHCIDSIQSEVHFAVSSHRDICQRQPLSALHSWSAV